MDDTISRRAAIKVLHDEIIKRRIYGDVNDGMLDEFDTESILRALPSAQPETHDKRTEMHACDCVSRQAAIDAINKAFERVFAWDGTSPLGDKVLENVPSARPERTCVNCGRTVNNGGWYADGRTRCPIEEHYALPKDGYCHLWEKRNVTDDDYPERREE
jgi:hypothetical protein